MAQRISVSVGGFLLLALLPLSIVSMPAHAREGLFVRFGLGSGLVVGASGITGEGLGLPIKNHAIGYGIADKFAVQIAEFGGLVHKKVGEFDYQNLDGFGLGAVFSTRGLLFSVAAGYGQVAFAREWLEATGTNKDEGFGFNASVMKEWPVSGRFALGAGSQAFVFHTTGEKYTLFNVGLLGSLTFYLKRNNQ